VIGVCVSGARGRMGRLLTDLVLAAEDLELSSVLERPGHPELGIQLGGRVKLSDKARAGIQRANVLLDFSLPAAVLDHLQLAMELEKPVVTGTTGFTPQQQEKIQEAAGRVAVVWASNMSRGVYTLTRLTELAAGVLPDHDVEIVEVHHRNKVDSPSGTALQLAGVVESSGGREGQVYGRREKRKEREVGIAAVRGGDVVGEHQVMFLGPGEQIVLTHRATTREHFCQGALAAVRFVASRRAGLYTMADVFGED
jgi:4-hydroxy-tetrahydrodipicolinate reductase